MKHQLLNNEELDGRCLYCNAPIDDKKWTFSTIDFFDYITAVCDCCKKENIAKIDVTNVDDFKDKSRIELIIQRV